MTQTVNNVLIENAQTIINHFLFIDDGVYDEKSGIVTVLDKLAILTRYEGVYVCPVLLGEIYPYELTIRADGQMIVSRGQPQIDVSSYDTRIVSVVMET